MVLVSVIIPSHDSGALLARAVDSVIPQTFDDFEIVIVDDGSVEPQRHIVGLDPRIRLIEQPNRGVSVARNEGVAAARGEYIAFLDHDDEWMPHKLARQLESVSARPDAPFWCTAFEWTWADRSQPSDTAPITYHGLLSTQTVLLSSVLVRRRDYWRVGGQNPVRARAEDWEFLLNLAMDAPPPEIVAEPLVRYHLHDRNASRMFEDGLAERLAVLDNHARRARRRGDVETLRAIRRGRARTRELFAHQAIDAGRECLAGADRRAALRHFAIAARLDSGVLAGAIGASVRRRVAIR